MPDPDGATRRKRRDWSRGEGIIVVAAALLVADLLLLPWHRFALDVDVGNLGIELPSFSYERSGVQSPNAWLGIGALTLAVLMFVQVLTARASPVMARLGELQPVAGPAVLGLLLAKLFTNDELLGAGAWLGVLLGAALALGGYLRTQEAEAPGPARGGASSAGGV